MLWDRKKPLNQPPGFGRLNCVEPEKKESDVARAATRALNGTRLGRVSSAQRHGLRRAAASE